MRKLLAATMVASLISTGAAFATSTPVLDIEKGQSHVTVDGEFNHRVALPKNIDMDIFSFNNPSFDGYNVTADYGLTDNLAIQLGYTRLSEDLNFNSFNYEMQEKASLDNKIKYAEVNAYYAVNENINLFAGVQKLKLNVNGIQNVSNKAVSKTSLQAGAVVHAPIADKVTAFGKIGFGNKNIERQMQLGVRYDINENFEVHAMYENNKVDLRFSNDIANALELEKIEIDGLDFNGYSIGFGYKF